MADTARDASADIEQDLLDNPSAYTYAQCMRLLYRLVKKQGGDAEKQIKVFPALDMGINDAELVSVTKKDHVYRVEVSFLGLYGVSSPLPNFYTEDLITSAQDDKPTGKDFLDIFHQRLYALYTAGLEKYFPLQAVVEKKNTDFPNLLLSCVGLRDDLLQKQFTDPTQLLKYVSLLGSKQRSAEGLKTLLMNVFEDVNIDIEQCLENYITVPLKYRFFLGESGHEIGNNALLGDKLVDRNNKIMVSIGPMSHHSFDSLLNDGRKWPMLISMIKFYLNAPLDCDLQLLLDIDGAQTTQLGTNSWSQLGQNTWLYNQGDVDEALGILDARLPIA